MTTPKTKQPTKRSKPKAAVMARANDPGEQLIEQPHIGDLVIDKRAIEESNEVSHSAIGIVNACGLQMIGYTDLDGEPQAVELVDAVIVRAELLKGAGSMTPLLDPRPFGEVNNLGGGFKHKRGV